MTKLMRMGVMMAAACLIVSSATGTAVAWHRGHVETFAVLPDYAPGVPEIAGVALSAIALGAWVISAWRSG